MRASGQGDVTTRIAASEIMELLSDGLIKLKSQIKFTPLYD